MTTPYDLITTVTAQAATYNLVTLAAAKTELEITGTEDDAWLTSAIPQISKAIKHYCQRVFQVEALTDTFYVDRRSRAHQRTDDGDVLQLTRFPVLGVTSVTETLPDGTVNTLVLDTDYVRNDRIGQLVRLNSDTGFPGHWRGAIIAVQYQAGQGSFASENYTIASNPGPYIQTVAQAATFSIDRGVSYTGGAALVPIASGTPAAGQYLCNSSTGIYTFAAADTGKAITIAYAFNLIEADLQDAALRLLTARFRAEARDPMLMEESQSGAPGSKRYWVGTIPGQNGAFPPEVAGLLDNYRVPAIA